MPHNKDHSIFDKPQPDQWFKLLIIEDEPDMANLLAEVAQQAGFETTIALNVQQGLQQLSNHSPQVVLTDLKLPDGCGMQVVELAKQLDAQIQVVMITGYASLQDAIDAFKFGLFDLITKPFDVQMVKNLLDRLHEYQQHYRRMAQMEVRLAQLEKPLAPISESPVMIDVLSQIEQVAQLDLSVLITGETGVGKGVLARYLHDSGVNPKAPYFELNCAAVPENLVESELFGYEKGAFTGASHRKLGLLELASGGTLLLDEINSTRLEVQAKLLHFLQNQTLVRVGGSETIKVNVRLVFATNQPLKPLVDAGQFREDLYYRINVFPICLPPLRERPQDLIKLAELFIHLYAQRFHKSVHAISPKAIEALNHYDWPGNIRELENIIQRSVVLAKGDTIELAHLPGELHQTKVPALNNGQVSLPEEASLAEIELLWIHHVLEACQGNKTLAAQKLGVDPSTLYRKLQQQKTEH